MFCSTTLAVLSMLGLTDPAPPVGLSAHLGRFPFEPISCTSFFEEPQVVEAVTAVAGQDSVDFLQSLDAAPPIVTEHGTILALACVDGDCDGANAALAITPQGRLVALCLYSKEGDHGGKPGETRWFGEKLKVSLPPGRGTCPHEPEQFLEAYAQARSAAS